MPSYTCISDFSDRLLGHAFGQAKLFEEAIAHYEKACGVEDAGMTLKDLEQLANLRIRWAVRLWPQGGSKKTDEIIRLIEAGKDLLDKIIQVCGPSSERLSLLGSAYKRLAWVRKEDRARSLAQMADQYREACAQAEKKKKRDPYALLNWLTAEIALDWQAQEQMVLHDPLPDFQDRLAQARMWAAAAFASKHTFWNEVMVADADLIEALSTGGLSKKQIEQLASKYRESRKRGSPREFESVLDQLDFLMAMAEASPPMAKALTTLRQRLREQSA